MISIMKRTMEICNEICTEIRNDIHSEILYEKKRKTSYWKGKPLVTVCFRQELTGLVTLTSWSWRWTGTLWNVTGGCAGCSGESRTAGFASSTSTTGFHSALTTPTYPGNKSTCVNLEILPNL